jgi:hypothetical protein
MGAAWCFKARSAPRALRFLISSGRCSIETAEAHFARKLFERSNPILSRWMGGEKVVHPTARQRVDDKERRGRRVSLSGIVWNFFRYARDFDERRSECAGRPLMRAPRLSAAYSRVRLIAICTIMAASGARMSMSIEPTMPRPLLSRLPPRKNMPNCASIEMAPAMVAVIVIVSVS